MFLDKILKYSHNLPFYYRENEMGKPLIEIKNITKQFGEQLVLDNVSFAVSHGEFLTLLGPSGCGKTTLLRMLSGFEDPTSGEIYINGLCQNNIPPQKRDVHTVFQSYALFPHLNVFDNVAFALRCKKLDGQKIQTRVMEALSMVRLTDFATRDIKQLSGGQQQRVAIARAIVNRPQVLLLDEPLSSLDYRLRKAMQSELKQLQKHLNITFIFVTHDQEEALSMSDRIVVFNHGHIEQIGTPREVYETPINLYVAEFIGEANFFNITVEKVAKTQITTTIEGVVFHCNNTHNFKVHDAANLMIRPEDVRVWNLSEVSDTKGMIQGNIQNIIYKGSTVDLEVSLPSGKLIYASEFFDEDDENLEYQIGAPVWIQWLKGWEVLLPHAH